jgi:hypothetical protein
MSQLKIPPSERISTSYKKLVSISPELHAAAKELSKTVDELNEALEPLNLGVAARATIASREGHSSGAAGG